MIYISGIVFLLCLYSIYIGGCILGWYRASKRTARTTAPEIPLSVIIPVRNEERMVGARIKQLLPRIKDITGSEILVVDDNSTDATPTILQQMESIPELTVIPLDGVSGKKAAITKGVEQARNEFIVTTDADVDSGEDWSSHISQCLSDPTIDMLIMPVLIAKGKGLLARMQQMDQAMLTGMAIGSAALGLAVWGSGAAMAFRKTDFLAVQGYTGNEHWASGDDVFLIHKFKKANKNIRATALLPSTVEAKPCSTWQELVAQRIRWGSKAIGYTDLLTLIVTALGVLRWLAIAALLFHGVWAGAFIAYVWLAVLVSLLMDDLLVACVLRSNSLKLPLWAYLFVPVFYLFFGVYLLAASLFQKPIWKGRNAVRFDP